jgi:hypothetical protein
VLVSALKAKSTGTDITTNPRQKKDMNGNAEADTMAQRIYCEKGKHAEGF